MSLASPNIRRQDTIYLVLRWRTVECVHTALTSLIRIVSTLFEACSQTYRMQARGSGYFNMVSRYLMVTFINRSDHPPDTAKGGNQLSLFGLNVLSSWYHTGFEFTFRSERNSIFSKRSFISEWVLCLTLYRLILLIKEETGLWQLLNLAAAAWNALCRRICISNRQKSKVNLNYICFQHIHGSTTFVEKMPISQANLHNASYIYTKTYPLLRGVASRARCHDEKYYVISPWNSTTDQWQRRLNVSPLSIKLTTSTTGSAKSVDR